jgi:proline iminopeptidase
VTGTELFVKRLGSGEPILVVHGGPVLDHGYLLPHLAPLADDYELVFFDQRLSGRSAGVVDPESVRLATFVDDIEALRSSLGFERMHLMGHSWGGLLAMSYAVRHGERLRSLMLLDSVPPSSMLWREENLVLAERETDEDRRQREAIRSSPEFQAKKPEAIARMLRASFAAQFHDRARISALELLVPDDYVERSRQFQGLGADLRDYDLLGDLSRVTAPTLVLYGADEPAATLAGPALVERLPHAELVLVPEAGHFPFIEQPEAFLRAVREFLEPR